MSQAQEAITRLFANDSLGAPENAVGFVLWRVVHRYQREVDRALVPLDLTHLQFTTLTLTAWLGRTGEPTTQVEVARFGDIQPMQVSHMLKALEQKELIARTRSGTDERAKRVQITATGLRTLQRALPTVIGVQRRLFGHEGAPGGSLLSTLLRLDEMAETGEAIARADATPTRVGPDGGKSARARATRVPGKTPRPVGEAPTLPTKQTPTVPN